MSKPDIYANLPLILKAERFAVWEHAQTNHKYDGEPYEVHLKAVVAVANRYRKTNPSIKAIPDERWEKIIAACWCHDMIEDARQTYNDVKAVVGEEVAEIVYRLTTEKGRTRSERANHEYYRGIRESEEASFVKLCDRIANMEHSQHTKSRMAEMYVKEFGRFHDYLYTKEFYTTWPLWTRLEELSGVKEPAK